MVVFHFYFLFIRGFKGFVGHPISPLTKIRPWEDETLLRISYYMQNQNYERFGDAYSRGLVRSNIVEYMYPFHALFVLC